MLAYKPNERESQTDSQLNTSFEQAINKQNILFKYYQYRGHCG